MFPTDARRALIEDQSIESWVRTMFSSQNVDGTDGVKVVVRVGDRTLSDGPMGALADHDEDVRVAIRELTRSLELYGGARTPGDLMVEAPTRNTIRSALSALVDPNARRRTLGAALATFGRRVVAPLETQLAAGANAPSVRLTEFRSRMRATIDELPLAQETKKIVRDDVERLLTDEYLAMLADYEEKTLRPQMAELAQRVLGVLASVFHAALDRFAANAESVADRIARQVPRSLALRDVPSTLKRAFVASVSDFLQVETEADLRGALATLSSQYAHIVPGGRALSFVDEWYGDVARECWRIIETYG